MQRIAIPYNYIRGKLFVQPFNNIGLITSCAKINIRKDWKINILQHKYNILYFGKTQILKEYPWEHSWPDCWFYLRDPARIRRSIEKLFTKVYRKAKSIWYLLWYKPLNVKGRPCPVEINKFTQSSFHYVTQILKFKMEIDVISIN